MKVREGSPREISRTLRASLGAVLVVLLFAATEARAEPATKVFLNGVATPVYFNDGDSFRVLAGKLQGSKARLSGYNTLESYGPAHQWGDWSAHEMFVLAKMATAMARVGVWRCTSDLETDTYGRTLWWCPDLAEAQVRAGLAHVMSVTDEPGDPKLIAAQDEAKAARRGMWAHGIPDYVLTSLHSITEEAERTTTYNRLVSSADGHSLKWVHDDNYDECAVVCDDGAETKARIDRGVAALEADAAVATLIAGADGARPYTDDELAVLVSGFARTKDVSRWVKRPEHGEAFSRVLERLASGGELGRVQGAVRACMIYVDFRRRFGGGRAECLR